MKVAKILPLVIFAIAFAFVEATVVVYLREILSIDAQVGYEQVVNKDQALVVLPGIAFLSPSIVGRIITDSTILKIEQFREAATLLVLGSIAFLSGKKLIQGVAYFLLAFGIWDIFYYIFLRLTIGWPKSLGDLDIFFLLPVPWVGPIITPMVISAIMILTSLILLNRKGG
ncbi:MAG: hypothetical protein A2Z11_04025 [Candidatus Woykebacteria bacterium RBG_16_43_9]|uniref:Uncharacterized protein n=1 Tax=Candidatus Woykebacteria bacterium RBG_16_43_9 TaxID=1802596 RepID=A0A1G1WG08_9BACT|nr:MAG: hypothetical protein A2Z11_04025 [Candidatus Woykebacteria bacterium RBG_16_43_9]